MNSKIINPSQYKKTTKEKRDKKIKITNNKIRRGKVNISTEDIGFINLRTNNQSKKKRFLGGIVAIFFMFVISIASAAIFSIEESPIINVFKLNEGEKINKDIDFKVASVNFDYNKNILFNELKSLSYSSVLKFDEEYNITYDLAESVVKDNELSYTIKFKKQGVNATVKSEIEKILSNNADIYYDAMKIIKAFNLTDNYTLNIELAVPSDYFVYYLDFPVDASSLNIKNMYNISEEGGILSFISNEKDILNKITILNYNNSFDVIENFKNGLVHMFLTTNEDDIKMLGRYDYNVKKYRDGEAYFLVGSKQSELFNMDEVRSAIAYSIDRNLLSKTISTSFTEVIDIPYIYSNINYKYDIYAAENMLIANSWVKRQGVYVKRINNSKNITLSLRLIVNSDDSLRCNLADSIKDMLEANGIKVSVEKLNGDVLLNRINSGDYDIALAKVNIGKSPDISFLYDYVLINDNLKDLADKVKNSSVSMLKENITNLKNAISDSAAIIGISAKNTYVITRKDIVGFEDISYMRIFKNIQNSGSIN